MIHEYYFNGLLTMCEEDFGDGTGLRTFYDSEGNVTGTEELTGLPIVEPVSPTPEERAQELFAVLASRGITPERLGEAIDLALGVTDPAAVEALATAVETSDPALGVAVLAESASRATTPQEGTQ